RTGSRGSDRWRSVCRPRAARRGCAPWPLRRSLASGERVAAPELIDGTRELAVLGARELRIAGEYAIGLLGRLADQLGVDIGEIDDAELRDAMLPRPEEFAGAEDGEVAFRQLEAVDR